MILRDRKGAFWAERLTVGSALFIRDDLGVDVMRWLADWDTAAVDLADAAIVGTFAYGLMHRQCVARGVTDAKFGRLIGKNKPAELAESIVEELSRFVAVPELLPGCSGGGKSKITAASLWASVWHCAAIAGIDPMDKTYGELFVLSDTARKHQSAQQALLSCVIANAQGGKTKPAEFDGTGYLKAISRDSKTRLDNIHDLSKALGVEIKVRRINGTK